MSLALLFPGQGSQHVGMAHTLSGVEPARRMLARADEALGLPITALMLEGPAEELTATKNAQPAILAHSIAVFEAVRERLGPVSFVAGHSLGEFSAHVAAGTISFEDALTAVRLRGELMYAAGEARPGTMAAVLGLEDDEVSSVCVAVQGGICVPANFNAPGQVVISGDVSGIEEAMARAKDAGAKRVVALNVSGAFHSPLMEPAVEGLRAKLESMSFRDPSIPVISNVTAAPVYDGAEARELLVRQLTAPVRWRASVECMVDRGVDRFLELGPGTVLHGLNKRNARGSASEAVGEAQDIEELGS